MQQYFSVLGAIVFLGLLSGCVSANRTNNPYGSVNAPMSASNPPPSYTAQNNAARMLSPMANL